MQRQIKRGASANAGLIFHVFAQDSASTTGAGKASVGFGSWSCRYIRNGETISGAITPEDITTIGTYAAPTANTNVRIKAVDNTNMIGVYEVQIHADWVNTTNSCQSLTIFLTATGVAPLPIQIQLVAFDPQAATVVLADSASHGGASFALTGVVQADIASAGGDTNVATRLKNYFGANHFATADCMLGLVAFTVTNQTEVVLNSGSTRDDAYNDCVALIEVNGGGYECARVEILDYVGSTKTLTFKAAPCFTIATNDRISIFIRSPLVDVEKLSGDATAADNAEAFFDGTGYAGTNNVIPTVTNLTNAPTAGDLTATMKASVNSEVDTALADINLDHLLKIAVDTNLGTTAHIDSVMDHLFDIGTTWTYDRTTDSLEKIGDTLINNLSIPTSALITTSYYELVHIDPDNAGIAAIKAKTDNLPTDPADQSLLTADLSTISGQVSTADGKIDAILVDTGTDGVVIAAASKTGFALSATGLDAIPTTAPSGVASTFREMIVQTWRRWFKKTHYDIAGNNVKTYADNGTTVVTTQVTSVSATDEDVGAAT